MAPRAMLRVVLVVAMAAGSAHPLQLASVWGFAGNGTYFPTLANVIFEESNLTRIAESAAAGAPALYPLAWTAPRPSAGPGGYCVSPIPRFHNTTKCVTIRPDVDAYLLATMAELQPSIARGDIVGFFLGDERMWSGASLANVSYVSHAIRALWPEAIIYINEAQDVFMCNFNRLNETIFQDGACVPEDLDLFGFDIYSYDNSSYLMQREAFVDNLYPRLAHSGQRLIPTTTGFGGRDSHSQGWPVERFDQACLGRASEFLAWALTDPLVGGIFPWHWRTYGPITESYGIGLVDLPRCRAFYQAMGEIVRASAPGRPRRNPHGPVRTTCTSVWRGPYSFCDTHH